MYDGFLAHVFVVTVPLIKVLNTYRLEYIQRKPFLQGIRYTHTRTRQGKRDVSEAWTLVVLVYIFIFCNTPRYLVVLLYIVIFYNTSRYLVVLLYIVIFCNTPRYPIILLFIVIRIL